MLGDKRLIQSIKLQNFLSFGPDAEEIELKSLNVLISPNASGKSNLIEAIGFLQASPTDLGLPIREGGGILEWLWKGSRGTPTAEVNVTVYYAGGTMPLRHRISFTMVGQRFELVDEALENEHPDTPQSEEVRFYYRYEKGHPVIRAYSDKAEKGKGRTRSRRKLRREDLALDQSILSQRKDPDQYPEITYLGNQYSKIRLYREWNLGRYTLPRLPQKADLPGDFLLEDASNLGLVLNNLEHKGEVWSLLLEKLKQFHEPFRHISIKIEGGTVQIFLHEDGLHQPIPATRLSDEDTYRWRPWVTNPGGLESGSIRSPLAAQSIPFCSNRFPRVKVLSVTEFYHRGWISNFCPVRKYSVFSREMSISSHLLLLASK